MTNSLTVADSVSKKENIDELASRFLSAVRKTSIPGEEAEISDETMRGLLTLLVKVRARKIENGGDIGKPFEASVTATETVSVVADMLLAADLNPFDLAMWMGRSGTA